jgi:Calcium-binding EGF domain/EGF domain
MLQIYFQVHYLTHFLLSECSQTPNPCSQNGYCANKLGSYRCGCKRGYAGDGVVCVDIDECLDNPCGANTFCTNLQGSFSCKCNPGFSLDTDVSCSDTDECSASPRPCDRRAYCINNVGGYYCECKAGTNILLFDSNASIYWGN